jgi:hypothetical protein
MAITNDVNASLLNDCFELGPFYGLFKSHPDDILKPEREVTEINENTNNETNNNEANNNEPNNGQNENSNSQSTAKVSNEIGRFLKLKKKRVSLLFWWEILSNFLAPEIKHKLSDAGLMEP